MTAMRSMDTEGLRIAYDDGGQGAPVLLLHGWPDDASTWDGVAPALHEAGLRTIAPMLRGFGGTRLAAGAARTANSGMLAMDAIALMDGLHVERFMVAGHDWGSNVAEALAVGWPDRVRRIAMLSSPPRAGGMPTPPFAQAQRYWYHWFMATARGAAAVRADPHGFARLMWDNWAPKDWYDDATFARVAGSFDNPDFVDVTLHSYRARWGEAAPDPRSAWLEQAVRDATAFALPALYIQGEVDGVNPPSVSAHAAGKFSGPFARMVLPGVGHFPTREAAAAVGGLLARHFSDVT